MLTSSKPKHIPNRPKPVPTKRSTAQTQKKACAVSYVGSDSYSDESLARTALVLVPLLPPVPPPRTNTQSHGGVSVDSVDHVSSFFQDSGSIDNGDVAANGSVHETGQEDGGAISVSYPEIRDVPDQPYSVRSSSSSDTVPSPGLTPSPLVPRPTPRRTIVLYDAECMWTQIPKSMN